MDHASFALKQHLLVLHQAGIRHLLASSSAPEHDGPAITPDPSTSAGQGDTRSGNPDGSGEFGGPVPASVLAQQPWAGLLAKVPQGVQSVWTYEGLGQDLTGQPSEERRKTLGRLLAAARLPKGFVGFFPYCLPSGNVPAQHQDVFLDAISRLNPASVVLFGESEVHPLHRLLSGVAIPTVLLQLPSLDVFSRMSDAELQAEADTLRTSIFQGP